MEKWLELLLVPKGDMAAPVGEIIHIGEGRGKAQHGQLCGVHHAWHAHQHWHVEETAASPFPLSSPDTEEAHT